MLLKDGKASSAAFSLGMLSSPVFSLRVMHESFSMHAEISSSRSAVCSLGVSSPQVSSLRVMRENISVHVAISSSGSPCATILL